MDIIIRRTLTIYLPAVLFLGVIIVVPFVSEPVEIIQSYLLGKNIVSYSTYVSVLMVAVVLMPLTAMPLIPLATSIIGPFATAVLSVIGWTLGAMIAFLISRYFGRPILKKFVPLEKLDDLLFIFPDKTRFVFIVLLRIIFPVDFVSYALGLTKSLGFIEYSIATFVGVMWFSFAFAYLGDALLTKNLLLVTELASLSLAIFLTGWYLLKCLKSK